LTLACGRRLTTTDGSSSMKIRRRLRRLPL